MKMERIPDFALLSVFRWLDAKDLLVARTVCHQWRTIGDRWYAWKNVLISDVFAGRQLFEAVLRVAPCVGVMSVTLDYPHPSLVTTSCATRSLTLSVWDDRAFMAWRVLKHQMELGYLRELRVHMHGDTAKFQKLMREICAARGLEKITLQNYSSLFDETMASHTGRSSLKEIYSDTPGDDQIHQNILSVHRRTLKVVSLPFCISAPLVALSRLKELRRLECPPMKDMCLLLECQELRAIAVWMESSLIREEDVLRVRTAIEGTVNFLSRGTQLEEFKLCCQETIKGEDLVNPLVMAPTKIGVSALKCIEVVATVSSKDQESPQRCLSETLTRMPQLCRITLNCSAGAGLCSVISPEAVPRLRELCVLLEICAHDYIHRPEVEDLLLRNPQLHLLMRDNGHCLRGDTCEACKLHCHVVLAEATRSANVGCFTHAELDVCGLEAHQRGQRVYLWLQL